MYEFYLWPHDARLLLTFLFAVCVLVQTVTLILSRYRHPKSMAHLSRNLPEAAILLLILCLSLLHGQVYMGIAEGFIIPVGYAPLRVAAFVFVAAAASFAFVQTRKMPVLPMLVAPVALPAVEAATGGAYPWLFVLSLLLLLVRGVLLSTSHLREIRTGISALSIKEAVDNLHTGVLFCRPSGRILLMSWQMQTLMAQIAGEIPRNGKHFYERLLGGYYDCRCGRAELEGQIVCIPPDSTAWAFTKTDLTVDGQPFVQISALDVTERWRLTAQLRQQDEALQQKSEELKIALANLHVRCREQAAVKAKMRAHDILGQRLTLLLRAIREEETPPRETLRALSSTLLQEMQAGSDAPTAQEQLDSLRQTFRSVGVVVRFEGSLPADEEHALLFTDIIRESVTNAVRHGFATDVHIRSFMEGTRQTLYITDNGSPVEHPVTEGGGLSGMRRKLAESGGALHVAQAPQFALTAALPVENV